MVIFSIFFATQSPFFSEKYPAVRVHWHSMGTARQLKYRRRNSKSSQCAPSKALFVPAQTLECTLAVRLRTNSTHSPRVRPASTRNGKTAHRSFLRVALRPLARPLLLLRTTCPRFTSPRHTAKDLLLFTSRKNGNLMTQTEDLCHTSRLDKWCRKSENEGTHQQWRR